LLDFGMNSYYLYPVNTAAGFNGPSRDFLLHLQK